MYPPIAIIMVLGVAVVYGIVLLVVNKFQRKLVFQTYPIFCSQKMSPGPGPPHFTITTSDCETLDALWAPVDAAHGKAILYLHGNAANLCSRETRIRALTELGFSVLAIDWRGYGKSTGSPSQEGLQLDAEAALDWLSRRIDLSNVVVLAESIATGVAVELVAKHQVRALVLEAPYFSAVSLAEAFLPFF